MASGFLAGCDPHAGPPTEMTDMEGDMDLRAAWDGHDRGGLRREQIVLFLRSVIASDERLSSEDIDDINAALAATSSAAPVLDVGRLALAIHVFVRAAMDHSDV